MNSNFFSPLLLVSKSPRRRDLLQSAGYQFESYTLEISEIIDENLNPEDHVQALSCLKMEHFLKQFKEDSSKYSVAMTFDTMVEFNGEVLGKPQDKNEALAWLLSYSGQTQKVHTGCSLYHFKSEEKKNWTSTTKVYFKDYGKLEALDYLDKEPSFINKAGGYGIQDKDFHLVSEIEGEYANVVGLPLKDLAKELKSWSL